MRDNLDFYLRDCSIWDLKDSQSSSLTMIFLSFKCVQHCGSWTLSFQVWLLNLFFVVSLFNFSFPNLLWVHVHVLNPFETFNCLWIFIWRSLRGSVHFVPFSNRVFLPLLDEMRMVFVLIFGLQVEAGSLKTSFYISRFFTVHVTDDTEYHSYFWKEWFK